MAMPSGGPDVAAQAYEILPVFAPEIFSVCHQKKLGGSKFAKYGLILKWK